jgi:hypothetical protein
MPLEVMFLVGCYILYSESLVEVDRLGVKVEGRGGSTRSESRRSIPWKIQIQSDQKKVEEVN